MNEQDAAEREREWWTEEEEDGGGTSWQWNKGGTRNASSQGTKPKYLLIKAVVASTSYLCF